MVLLVFLLFLTITIVATYPLIKEADQRVPFDLGDPLFMGWLVSWNDSFMLHPAPHISKLFNTNIYYPYKNTLAYSDLMLVPSLMVLPVYYLTHNPLITVNALLILLLAGTGLAMFLLARYLTGNPLAGFIAGCLYAFSTYHQAQIGHIQLHTDLFLLLMLLWLHKWLDNQKPAYLLAALSMLALEALSSWYYAIYGVMIAAAFGVHFLLWRRLKLDRRNLAALIAGVFLIGLAVYPFVRPYLDLHKSMPGFERNVGETAFYAADPSDYIMTVPQNWFWGRTLGLSKPGVEDILFPGLAVLVLAAIGSAGLIKSLSREETGGVSRLFYLCLAWMALILSFGPYKIVHGRFLPLPFLLPFELMPGFKAMRVPARFGVLVLLGLCILAAFGFDRLQKVWRDRRVGGRSADATAVLVLALLFFQQTSWPIPLSPPIASGKNIPPIYKWLAGYRRADVVMELPALPSEQVKYVYFSAYHAKRLVNGYSGYTPPLWTDLQARTAAFPASGSVGYLRRLGVDGVLIHSSTIPDWQGRLKSTPFKDFTLVKHIGADYFFKIGAARPAKIRL